MAPRQDRRKLHRPPLILAHEFQKLLDHGVLNTRADIARRHNISQARVTQVMNLLRLPHSIRASLMALPEEEQRQYAERRLRRTARRANRETAVRALAALSRSPEANAGP